MDKKSIKSESRAGKSRTKKKKSSGEKAISSKGETEMSETEATLHKKLKEEREKSEDYFNKLQYLKADFDNYRKRIAKNKEKELKDEKSKLLRKILPVLDDLERAIATSDGSEGEALKEGIEMVVGQTKKILEKEGVKPLHAEGKEFDPNVHEAVDYAVSDRDGVVIEEKKKGYKLDDVLIRPSEVIVGKRCEDE